MVKLSFAVLSHVLAEYIPAWRLNSPATKFSRGFSLCVVTSRLIQDLAQGFNCGLCTWKDQGLCCDDCGKWFHAACQSIGSTTFSALNDNDVSWICCSWDCPNYSTFFSYHNLDLTNIFKWLSWTNFYKKPYSIGYLIPLC